MKEANNSALKDTEPDRARPSPCNFNGNYQTIHIHAERSHRVLAVLRNHSKFTDLILKLSDSRESLVLSN